MPNMNLTKETMTKIVSSVLPRSKDMPDDVRHEIELQTIEGLSVACKRVSEDWQRCGWSQGGTTLGLAFYFERELRRRRAGLWFWS